MCRVFIEVWILMICVYFSDNYFLLADYALAHY